MRVLVDIASGGHLVREEGLVWVAARRMSLRNPRFVV